MKYFYHYFSSLKEIKIGVKVKHIAIAGNIGAGKTTLSNLLAKQYKWEALYEDTNISILAVNIAESPQVISEWLDIYGLTFPIVLDPQQAIYSQYRIIGQPTTVVITPDGIISHIFYGATTFDALQTALETHQANG